MTSQGQHFEALKETPYFGHTCIKLHSQVFEVGLVDNK